MDGAAAEHDGPPMAHTASRTRVRGEDARARLIEAVITLLRTEPLARISVRRIAEVAELNTSTMLWNFHRIELLFGAVVAELDARSERWINSQQTETAEFAEALRLRTRLVTWMSLSGMDTTSVDTSDDGLLSLLLQRRNIDLLEISPRTARTFAMVEAFLAESVILMRDVHSNWSDEDIAAGLDMFAVI
ncbi:MAG: hypothetical protein WCG96_12155, partial [Actinomycetes bacterium]